MGCSRTLVAALVCVLAPVAAFGAQDAPDPSPRAVTLEFDVPPQVETKGSVRFELRAVEIAVFSSTQNLQSVTVERSAWQILGNKAQVSFQIAAVPPRANPVILRVRFLSNAGAGQWSTAIEGIRAPETSAVEEPSRASRPPRGVPLRALDTRSALKKAVIDLLGSNERLETTLSGFNNVRDLALAVVISRAHKLKFGDLCAAMKGPPPLRLPAALLQLNPKLDANSVIRSARDEARILTLRDGQAAPRR
jgi:hypothetical protein